MVAAAKPGTKSTWLEGMKGWLVALTGVLVVLPALINALADIYAAAAKLPRTEAERVNARLYREYFRKSPVLTMPVAIKQGDGTVEARFEIYERGDVRVEFGSSSQWFPFPSREPSRSSARGFSVFSEAIAQGVPPSKGMGSYQQSEHIQNDAVVRMRTYENGVVEKVAIDPRTGELSNASTSQSVKIPVNATQRIPEIKVAPVDLDKLRTPPAAPTAVPAAATAEPEWHRGLKAGLAWCGLKDNFLSKALCRYRERARFCEPGDHWGKVPECEQ